ncbi:MAG: GerMN domain-containing protein [Proteobacteria bacterium]|nr:GerMN domain-containing protein [Pseudomonadota bacterium]
MAKKAKPKKKPKSKPRSKKSPSIIIRIVIFLVLVGITAGSVYLIKNPEVVTRLSQKEKTRSQKPVVKPPSATPIKEEIVRVNLYFSDSDSDYLSKESRKLVWKRGDVKNQIRVIVEELIKGPEGDLFQTIPPKVAIRSISLKGKGTGIINFSRELSQNHPGGTLAEMHTIYSIVNSLLLNISSLKEIQILIEGEAPETLKGHIDCRAPFKSDLSIIKAG